MDAADTLQDLLDHRARCAVVFDRFGDLKLILALEDQGLQLGERYRRYGSDPVSALAVLRELEAAATARHRSTMDSLLGRLKEQLGDTVAEAALMILFTSQVSPQECVELAQKATA